jgi:hypothetical protein
MATLTTEQRKRMKSSSFALPRQRAYPINDLSHARMALAMVAAHGTDGEQSKVKRAVYKKYPSLNKTKK